ncbi:MAG: 50S ribosomal protein L19e [Candidatus Hadarchaeota archaeon]
MKLNKKRRLASEILKVGVNRVWIDPTRGEDVSAAITREDIRSLVNSGAIKARPEKGTSRGRARERAAKRKAGKRKGHGSRRGSKHARFPRKERWIQTIRPVRERLVELKKQGAIGPGEYRKLYGMAKGGMFKNRGHLEVYLKERGTIKG